ncbi:MAG: hypothetical protein H7145_00020 [Akkermansiaceae bacterium]|nr:hypothetical protein [Armatimonadota bacterium]
MSTNYEGTSNGSVRDRRGTVCKAVFSPMDGTVSPSGSTQVHVSADQLPTNVASSEARVEINVSGKVVYTFTWQPKNANSKLDPPPTSVVVRYRCQASAHADAWYIPTPGDGESDANATVTCGNANASASVSHTNANGVDGPESIEDNDSDTKDYVLTTLPVNRGVAVLKVDFNIECKSYAFAAKPTPNRTAGGGPTVQRLDLLDMGANSSGSISVDIRSPYLDAGRHNGIVGSVIDGVKKFATKDPSFTRWLPLSFSPTVNT